MTFDDAIAISVRLDSVLMALKAAQDRATEAQAREALDRMETARHLIEQAKQICAAAVANG